MAPPFLGEDFRTHQQDLCSADLSGATVVISIEPSPDNSPAPFTLKPLVSMIGDMPAHHTPYNENNAAMTNPSGSVAVKIFVTRTAFPSGGPIFVMNSTCSEPNKRIGPWPN